MFVAVGNFVDKSYFHAQLNYAIEFRLSGRPRKEKDRDTARKILLPANKIGQSVEDAAKPPKICRTGERQSNEYRIGMSSYF
jgi:hypothetical protein